MINTGPLIALVAALDDLAVLEPLYQEVLVPFEVRQETRAHRRRSMLTLSKSLEGR